MRAEQAADHVLAANVGITLFLITAEEPDLLLSVQVREATLAAITGLTGPQPAEPTARPDVARLLLHNLTGAQDELGEPELALFRKWLGMLAAPDH